MQLVLRSLELASEFFHGLVEKSRSHRAFRPEWKRAKFQKKHGRGWERNLKLREGKVIYLVTKNARSGMKEFVSGVKLKLRSFYHCFSYYNSFPLSLLDKKSNNLLHQSPNPTLSVRNLLKKTMGSRICS